MIVHCSGCHSTSQVSDKPEKCPECGARGYMNIIKENTATISSTHKTETERRLNMNRDFKNESGEKILSFVSSLGDNLTLEQQRNLLAVAYRKISDKIKETPAVEKAVAPKAVAEEKPAKAAKSVAKKKSGSKKK